ncbi:Rv3235 family protein [Streptomyces djakartensis]|uniref:Rv3235 family protein n=1 Tax=Streptomyces djakartensis TaxID=68193 RepID=UPI003F7EA981
MYKVMTRACRPAVPPPTAGPATPRPGNRESGIRIRTSGVAVPPRDPGGGTTRATAARAGREPGTAPRTSAGTTPPRSPGGGTTRAPAAGDRPPASARGRRPHTRPGDTRPPTPSGTRRTSSRGLDRAQRSTLPAPTGTHPPSVEATPGGATRAPAPVSLATPNVPSRTPRRPVPHLLPTDRFADLLLAVLSGHRPVHSMLRHTRGRAYDELAWLAERGPLRTRGARPVVRDIGYCEPRPGAIEAFARIGAGDQLRAMAFRLELGQDLRWRCTAVELGGPRPPHAGTD